MQLDELLLNMKSVRFQDLVCQADVRTDEDKQNYQSKGYMISLTAQEFRERFGIDPHLIWYGPSVLCNCLYFNPTTFAVCPFSSVLFASMGDGNAVADVQSNYEAAQIREQEVANGEYLMSIETLPDGMRMEYFQRLVEQKGDAVPNLYHLFMEFYADSDYGFGSLPAATMEYIIGRKTPAEKGATTRALNKLSDGDTLTVYRGGNSASVPYDKSYSWTLSENVANFFAIRRGDGPAYIAQGEVSKKDVIEYLNDRNEQEIIVAPAKVQITNVTHLKDWTYLEDAVLNIIPMYYKYRDKLKYVPFYRKSNTHDQIHSLRVLFLCLLIAEELGVDDADQEILAKAAILHDCMRNTDGVEPNHGKRAAECIASNRILKLLCEYHCLPDEQGYAAIERQPWSTAQKEWATQLFQIFKDADGLDRVRLGNIQEEMDLKQYRLPITKKLTLIARLCLEQLQL